MHKIFAYLLLFVFATSSLSVSAQKMISEGMVKYTLQVQGGEKEAELLNGTEVTIRVKGMQSRQDRIGKLGKETSTFDAKSSKGSILKSYAGQDLLIDLSAEEWKLAKQLYHSLNFSPGKEIVTIGKFTCQTATAEAGDGSGYRYTVYFDPNLSFSNRDFEFSFGKIIGLPVRIDVMSDKLTFRYELTAFNTDPISYGVFDMPKGLRVISYKDFIQLQKGKKN
jgi:hypothetical protein